MLSNSSRPQCVSKAKQHGTWAMIFIRQDNKLLDCFASQYSLCAKWTINTQYLNSACYKLKRRRISACEKNYIFAILNGNIFIKVTSSWARLRLKSPALWLFTQPIIQAQIKENIKSSASLAFVCGSHRWPVNPPPIYISIALAINSNGVEYLHVRKIIFSQYSMETISLKWRPHGRDCVSNHQPYDCLLNPLFRRRSKKTSKALRHWPLCVEFTGDRWILTFTLAKDNCRVIYNLLSVILSISKLTKRIANIKNQEGLRY